MNGKCANCRLSQRKGSPQIRVPKLCPRIAFLSLFDVVAKRKISNLQIALGPRKFESHSLRQNRRYYVSAHSRGMPHQVDAVWRQSMALEIVARSRRVVPLKGWYAGLRRGWANGELLAETRCSAGQ